MSGLVERAVGAGAKVVTGGPLVAEMPHGGFEQSGMGKDTSAHSLEHYTELKHVMISLGERPRNDMQ